MRFLLPGLIAGILIRSSGILSESKVGISNDVKETKFVFKSAFPQDLSIRQASPITLPPLSIITSILSLDDKPVVTMSSTSKQFDFDFHLVE